MSGWTKTGKTGTAKKNNKRGTKYRGQSSKCN